MKPIHHHNAALLSAAIYAPDEHAIREELCKLKFPSAVAEIVDGGAPLFERGMVVPMADAVYLVFRGTVNRPQWISNVKDFKKVSFFPSLGNEKCHRGFLTGFRSLSNLWRHLEPWRARKIVVCGHSRGAAEALIAAQLLDAEGFDVKEVHLFGCPRVFDRVGAPRSDRLFGRRMFRWVANNDTVCRLPWRWMGFRHCGQELYFDSSDRLHGSPSFLTKLKGQYRGRKKGGWLDGLSDHNAADEYVRLVTGV